MPLSALNVFSSYVQGTITEVIAEQVEKFNAASNNAIILRTGANDGDYSDATSWALISGLVKRRNAYGSGAVAAVDLAQLLETSVKVAAGTPPVNLPPSMFRWILKNPEEGGAVYGQQLAKARIQDMIEVGVSAYVAAVGAEATNVFDGTAAGPSMGVLNKAAAKMGDASGRIAAWVMHSTSLHDLYGTALANAERLFNFGNVQVLNDGFGRPLIMTDLAALVDTVPVTDEYMICGLQTGGIMIEDNQDFDQNVETSNGDENILRSVQSEWSYQAALKGFAWDKAAGGASPTTAALATAANWDKAATSHKDLAGVLAKVIAA